MSKMNQDKLLNTIIENNLGEELAELLYDTKKEIFDELEPWIESDGLTNLEKCTCSRCTQYRRIKAKHLTNNSNKTVKTSEFSKTFAKNYDKNKKDFQNACNKTKGKE